MITYTIYHIPGRKVGCTKNFKRRMALYLREDGVYPNPVLICEQLYDVTDQEAGDREWEWADKFGYSRGIHYSLTIRAQKFWHKAAMDALSPEQRVENGRRASTLATPEQRSERSRKGGVIGGRRAALHYLEVTTPQRRIDNATKASHRALEVVTDEQLLERGRLGGIRRMEMMTDEERSEFARSAGSKGGSRSMQNRTPIQRSEFARKGGIISSQLRSQCPHCSLVGKTANMKRWHFNNCKKKSRIRRRNPVSV